MQQHWQDFLQGGAHYLQVKQQDFLVMNAGQSSNIALI